MIIFTITITKILIMLLMIKVILKRRKFKFHNIKIDDYLYNHNNPDHCNHDKGHSEKVES